MYRDVQPAPDGVVGRVLPRLETVAMAEVMGGFPIVESLVTVLDRREQCGYQIGNQESVEGKDGLYGERIPPRSGRQRWRVAMVSAQFGPVQEVEKGLDILLLGVRCCRMNIFLLLCALGRHDGWY